MAAVATIKMMPAPIAATLSAGRRLAGYGGMIAGVLGVLAAFRNVTPAVALVAEANNYVLPIWLIVLGAVLLRTSSRVGVSSRR